MAARAIPRAHGSTGVRPLLMFVERLVGGGLDAGAAVRFVQQCAGENDAE
jgi:hypothetical protein